MDVGLLRKVLASFARCVRPAHDPLGSNASSDTLRRCAKCTACGHKGATLQHPGWVDSVVGFQPFPSQ